MGSHRLRLLRSIASGIRLYSTLTETQSCLSKWCVRRALLFARFARSSALCRRAAPRTRSRSRSIFARCDMTLTARLHPFFPRAERANLRAQGTQHRSNPRKSIFSARSCPRASGRAGSTAQRRTFSTSGTSVARARRLTGLRHRGSPGATSDDFLTRAWSEILTVSLSLFPSSTENRRRRGAHEAR
jgi:hypothetical protein